MAPAGSSMKNRNRNTKFPVARIKRIMQKDEEVGKVAQATPIVISKALELFLALIVDEAASVTQQRGSKKVEAYHLKHAIETTEMLDFLKELVEAVPDPSNGGAIDLEAEAAEAAAAKKKRKGKRAVQAEEGDETMDVEPKKKRKRKAKVEKPKEETEEERDEDEEMGEPSNGHHQADDDYDDED